MLMSPRAQKAVAVGIAIGSATCLVATSLMTRQSGFSQAASEEGQALIGYSSVAIHLMAVLFALAAGVFVARKWYAATIGAWFLVISCCVLSVTNILEFVAAERLTIAKARETQAKAVSDREKARLDADKARLDAQLAMAKDAQGWAKGTIKSADGRRERKDTFEAVNKIVETVGKGTSTKIEVHPEQVIIARPDGGAELVNEVTGLSVSVYQLFRALYFVFVITLVEMVGWNAAAFMWMTAVAVPPLAAAAAAMAMTPPGAPLPPMPPPLPVADRRKALPAPSRQADDAITVRMEPTSEWRALLDQLDFPPPGARHKGPLRPKLDADSAALRFLSWLGAFKEGGEFHTTKVDALYEEMCAADHREQTGIRVVKAALESMRGKVASKKQVPGEGTVWLIQPPPLEKMVALLQKAGSLSKPETPSDSVADGAQDTGGTTAAAILPFGVSAAGSAAGQPGNDNATRTQAEIARGLWSRVSGGKLSPDWEGMRALGRLQKSIWQSKAVTPNRKSLNRLSRARGAA